MEVCKPEQTRTTEAAAWPAGGTLTGDVGVARGHEDVPSDG
jgi:hypothetical protein